MDIPLRQYRAATEWASIGQVIEIADKISSFSGLAEILEKDLEALNTAKVPPNWREMSVAGVVRFGYADVERRIPSMTGRLSANVAAVCQRCLAPFELTLDIEPKLMFLEADGEGGTEGSDDFEVWELQENRLRPLDVVEELLVMAMPLSARHDKLKECIAVETNGDIAKEKTIRPFAALRSQMKQND